MDSSKKIFEFVIDTSIASSQDVCLECDSTKSNKFTINVGCTSCSTSCSYTGLT